MPAHPTDSPVWPPRPPSARPTWAGDYGSGLWGCPRGSQGARAGLNPAKAGAACSPAAACPGAAARAAHQMGARAGTAVGRTSPGTGSQQSPPETPAQCTAPPQLPGPGAHGRARAAQHSIESCTTQHGTAQLSTAQCGAAWHSTAQHGAAWHGTVPQSSAQRTTHGTMWRSMAQRSTACMARCGAARHGTAQQSAAQLSTAQHAWHGTTQRSTAWHSSAQHAWHSSADHHSTCNNQLGSGAGRAAACSKEGKRAGCVGRGAAGCRPGCMLLRDSRAMPSCAELCRRVLGRAAPRRAVRAALGSVPACVRWGGQPALIKAAIRR